VPRFPDIPAPAPQQWTPPQPHPPPVDDDGIGTASIKTRNGPSLAWHLLQQAQAGRRSY
jgi:hypothetical protein